MVVKSDKCNPSLHQLLRLPEGTSVVVAHPRYRSFGFTVNERGQVSERGMQGGNDLRGPGYYSIFEPVRELRFLK